MTTETTEVHQEHNGQAATSASNSDLEGGAHPKAGYAKEASAGKADEEVEAVNI